MGKKQRQVVSDFDDDDNDLLGDNDDLDEHSDNAIVKAAFSDDDSDEDEDWEPPKDDDEEEDDSEDDDDSDDDSEDDTDEDSEEDDEEDDDDKSSSRSDDEEDDDQESRDDAESFSKRVQARIERERQLRLKSERRLKKLENQGKLRDAKDEFETTRSKKESELRKLRKKKRQAIEDGETDTQEELDDQILDIKADIRQSRADYERLEKELTAEPEDDEGDTSGLPEPAQRWLEKYPQFNTNQKFKNAVLGADQIVFNRGLDKNTDKYYEEIEKILALQFPEIVKPAKKSNKRDVRRKKAEEKRKKRRRSPVGGTTKPGTRRKGNRNRRGQIRLTKTDKAQMEEFGLDPTDKEAVREWARNKTD